MRKYYFHKMTVCKGCEIFPLAALKFKLLDQRTNCTIHCAI